MTFEKYVHIIENLLQKHWALEKTEVTVEEFAPNQGKINGKIVLLDGSFIEFSERVSIRKNQVTKIRYRFQYVKNKQAIFRYDNFPGHPDILPPHHHKHVLHQDVTQLSEAPKLIDIIEEAIRHMF